MTGRALIIGSAGQDGHYLARLLSAKGYWVAGVDHGARSETAALNEYWTCDLRDPVSLSGLIDQSQPTEIYYLAAQNFSSEDVRLHTAPVADVITVNLTGAAVTLAVIASRFPRTRFFFAGSCHVFGEPLAAPQNEDTPHNPTTPYGISKSAGIKLCKYFRESAGVFAVAGILFNHESPLRQPPFVTARIAHAAARVAIGKGKKITVRDANAVVDWGAAADYVEAMWLTLTAAPADDYVIATGVPRTIAEFAETAFRHVGASWEDWVVSENSSAERPTPYVGDSARLKRATGWSPRTSFQQLVAAMVDAQKETALL